MQTIQTIEPFSSLTLSELSGLLEKGRIISLEKNEVLFHEGLKASYVYVFLSGCMQLKITAENGREMVVRTMDDPVLFAEVVLCGYDEYPVTAFALKESRVYEFLLADMKKLLELAPFRDTFIRHIMTKQVYLTKRLEKDGTLKREGKVLTVLVEPA